MIWAVCRSLVTHFPEQFTPPKALAYFPDWIKYVEELNDNIVEYLQRLSFHLVNQCWRAKMGWELDKVQPYNETFCSSEDNKFAWKMMIPSQNVLDLYTAIVSIPIPKKGIFVLLPRRNSCALRMGGQRHLRLRAKTPFGDSKTYQFVKLASKCQAQRR